METVAGAGTSSVNDPYYKGKNLISIWPNPASDVINLDPGELKLSGISFLTIMDLSGKELIKVPFREQIDISSLHKGIYIIITSINGRPIGYNRLIKTK
jgi:hypothetical protein